MTVLIKTATYLGIKGNIISVEVDIEKGLPCFSIVGLPDASVRESKERVRSAIVNSGFEFPMGRITINLAPADIRKEGALFDLPIAIGIILASGQIADTNLEEFLFMGELSLSGELRKVKGCLPIVMEGINNNIFKFIVPFENAEEASLVKKSEIFPFNKLREVIDFLIYEDMLPYERKSMNYSGNCDFNIDFQDVIGQESAKRAVEVACAGGHNIALVGPPGSGKTMLCKRIQTILPPLTYEEALEVTKIYSVSGENYNFNKLINKRPFRSPHHSASMVALIGGGASLKPGEISLANNGVLFFDELLEFNKKILDSLRQPLEDKQICISRNNGSVVYPANFMFVASLNPCPCGFYLSEDKPCVCSIYERNRYLNKLSGPIQDRIDIFSFVKNTSYNNIKGHQKGESSKQIGNRIKKARKIQRNRFINMNIYTNSEMNEKQIRKFCKLDNESVEFVDKIYNRFKISTRAYSRILKVSRTIADLNERKNINKSDVIEAIQYRHFLNNEII